MVCSKFTKYLSLNTMFLCGAVVPSAEKSSNNFSRVAKGNYVVFTNVKAK